MYSSSIIDLHAEKVDVATPIPWYSNDAILSLIAGYSLLSPNVSTSAQDPEQPNGDLRCFPVCCWDSCIAYMQPNLPKHASERSRDDDPNVHKPRGSTLRIPARVSAINRTYAVQLLPLIQRGSKGFSVRLRHISRIREYARQTPHK